MDHDDDLSAAIGLSRADPDEPGIVRQRSGRGFTFRWPDGTVVRGSHRERCEALVIPPAWTDVWISPDPDGHLQAVGHDEAGRRQYRYHDRWIQARNAQKFDRLAEIGGRLAQVRRAVERDLRSGDREHRAVAAMIRLMDHTLERIGNAESVERFGTRGISTLGPGNVDVSSTTVQLTFRGKGRSDHQAVVVDRDLARVIAELEDAGQAWLFEVDGSVVDADDANAYLSSHSAGVVSCKDMRTWGGSAAALTVRIEDRATGPQIADAAAEALNNTRSVARESYIHPAVFDASDDAVTNAWRTSRSSRWYSRPERTLLKLLHRAPPLLRSYHC
jgi:DNA topoisomerase-1